MAGTLITISDAFRAALVAPGNTGTNAHKVTKIGLCTAAFDATNKKLMALPNERKRIDTFGGQNIDADTIHVTLTDNTADQFTLWGFGFYLEDGTLAAYYSQKAADGPIMEKSPAAQLLLSVDVVFASIDAATLSFPPASFLNPPSTEQVQGVIELATQAETDAGTDDLRAVTPKKAAARYAPFNRPTLTGPVTVTGTPTTNEGHIALKPPSGALSRESKLRFHGTFSGSSTDTGVRHVASIRGGFDSGAWGREYLDFYLNSANNDNDSDANQSRAMRLSYGGRVMIGTTADDGSNALQVAGNLRAANFFVNGQTVTDGGTFGFGNANGPAVVVNGNSAAGAAGALVTKTAGTERMRVNAAGRVLMGTTTDDGASLLQVAGNVAVTGSQTVTSPVNNTVGSLAASAYAGGLSIEAFNVGNTAKKNVALAPWGGRVLVGTTTDDGGSALQVNGRIYGTNNADGNPGLFLQGPQGFAAGLHLINTTPTTGRKWSMYSSAAGNLTFGDETAAASRLAILGGNGRVLVGTVSDDGSSRLQVNGDSRTYGVHRSGAAGTVTAWVSADANYGYFRTAGHATVGSEKADGYTDLVAGNVARVRVLASGRVLMGQTATDDGSSALQVTGTIKGIAGVRALQASNGSGTGQTSITLTREGAAADTKVWEVLSGGDNALSIRAVNDAYSGSTFAMAITRPSGIGLGAMQLMPDQGNVLVGKSTDTGGDRLQVAGTADFSGGYIKINRSNGEGQVWLGKNDGYMFANANEMGWYSPTQGKWSYDFAKRNLMVATYPVWHSGNLTPLDKNSGGQVNGTLTLYGSGDYGSALIFNANGYAPRIQAQASTGMVMVTNGANTFSNLLVWDGGQVAVSRTGANLLVGGTTAAGGSNATIAPDGNVWGTQWGSKWLRQFLDETFVHKVGDTMTNSLTLTGGSVTAQSGNDYNGYSGTVGPGWIKLAEYNYGGYIDFAGARSQDFVWRIHYNRSTLNGSGDGNLQFFCNGQGNVQFSGDSNIYCDGRGWVWDNITDAKNRGNNAQNTANDAWNKANDAQVNRADRNANCQWNTGIVEFGPAAVGQSIDVNAPYVMVGLRTTNDGNSVPNRFYPRAVILRNN
ncbi:hypothetical protein [Paraburkholderia oxyphila]|uniref:hypothetical protein n=1 Tax=Paraburkholderia oxyphila TaxID=614212 RepID=UPI000694C5B0|nr:hypothetical protein [Paraburkholderia oxyphila]